MKKNLLFVIAMLFAITLFSQEKVIIRFSNPEPITVKKFTQPNYDVAAYKPGEFLDLVVTDAEYQKILDQGYSVEIVKTIAEMAANLGNVDDINGYRTYEEALTELQNIAAAHPSFCKLIDIGNSRGKNYYSSGYGNYSNYQHDIWALKVSDNVELEEDEPSVYYFGAHHAREPLSTEVAFYVLNYLVSNYGSNPEVTANINSKEIWFVPIVNPDGHEIVLDQINTDWRKNIRDNDGNGNLTPGGWDYPDGVDLNRNYGWEWGGTGTTTDPNDITYCGPEPFSEPETQAIKDLLANHHFVAGISYHTYSELVLWPYGYQDGAVAPDVTALEALGTAMGNSIPGISGGHYTPQPCWALYPCSGVTDDYSYGKHGIFGYTIELGTEFIPPANEVYQICEDNLQAAMILLNRVNAATLTGHITNATSGDPLVAEIYVQGIDNTGLYREPYKSDEDFGTYYRLLPNGNYTVTFSKFGYISQTFNNVNINSTGQTTLDVALVQSQIIAVSGTVTDSDSGDPISGAMIQVLNTPIDPVYTNGSGQYVIPEIYENTYSFRVFALNYATLIQEVQVNENNTVVDFELTESTAISFETGTFGQGWTFGGNANWTIDGTNAWDGQYSAKSGNIGNSQTTQMMITKEAATAGTISFYVKVSSEQDYDYLKFYIDNQLKNQWSGNVAWTEVSYDVFAGNHTYKWVYEKDVYVVSGSDCGWVDYIIFPPSATVTSQAGSDGEICEDETFQCAGSATYFTSVIWSTSGDGLFNNPSILNPVYTPGTSDITAGSAVLTLTATDNSGNSDSDDLVLTIDPLPGEPSAIAGESEVCAGSAETYTCPAVAFAQSYDWAISPENAFSAITVVENMLEIVWSDAYFGSADITVMGINECGDGPLSETFSVEIHDCTGIIDLSDYGFTLSPNPVNDFLTISFDNENHEFVEIEVLNMPGETIFRKMIHVTGSELSIDVSPLTNGMYLVRLKTPGATSTKKIVINR